MGAAVELHLTNSDGVGHDFTLPRGTVEKFQLFLNPGLSVHSGFEPRNVGSFEFYCSQPGHKAAGMKGILEVEP